MVWMSLEDSVQVESLQHNERMARQMGDQVPLFDRLHATDDADESASTVFVLDYGHALTTTLPGLECTILCAELLVPC